MADSDAVERALAATRAAFVAPAPARVRLRASLQASGASGALPAPARVAATGVAKSTVALLVALGIGAGYWLGRLDRREPLAPLVAAPMTAAPATAARGIAAIGPGPVPSGPPQGLAPSSAASADVPESSTASATPAVDGERAVSSESAARARSGSPRARAVGSRGAPPSSSESARIDRFAEELALLQRAEHALRAGEAELALSFVGDLEQRYPQSMLSEERGALRIMAECLRSTAGSRDRAELFLSDRSASVYTDRVRRICELDTASQVPGSQLPGATDGSRTPGH